MASILPQVSNGGLSALARSANIIIAAMIKSGSYAKIKTRTRCPELEKVFADGINAKGLKIYIDPSVSRNAFAMPPMISKNNPMLYDFWRNVFGSELEEEGYNQLRRNQSPIGWVDADGKFYGMFQDLGMEITLGWDLVNHYANGFNPDSQGTTGILFHELGHLTSYLIALNHTVRTIQVLTATHNSMMDLGNTADRKTLLQDIEKIEGIEIPDLEYVARENKKELTTTVLLGASAKKLRNELGDDVYNLRGFEALSDHFATQHGLGRPLMETLDKMYIGSPAKYKSAGQCMTAMLETFLMLVASIYTLGIFLAFLMFGMFSVNEKIYDDPKDRFARTRRQLIEQLKNSSSSEGRNKLLEDIDKIDEMMKTYHNNRGVMETIFETLSPTGRKNKQVRELSQSLEKLANNELFVSANRLKQLA